MTHATDLAAPNSAPRHFLAALLEALRLRRRRRFMSSLSPAQIKDAGIDRELAGYGRGAAVSMLVITNLQSQR